MMGAVLVRNRRGAANAMGSIRSGVGNDCEETLRRSPKGAQELICFFPLALATSGQAKQETARTSLMSKIIPNQFSPNYGFKLKCSGNC
eukprot:2568592-Amphidinium_carterae.1